MNWSNLQGWDWTDIALDGSLDDAALREVIDDSYRITVDSLSDNEKACLSLLSRNLDPSSLVEELLTMNGLQPYRDQIVSAGKQAFLLRTEPSQDDQLAVGQSKVGGLPDLAEGVSWPVYSDGKPLAFLAQINLAEVPTNTALPQSGLLSFFSVFGWQEGDDADPQLPSGSYKNDWTRVLYSPSASLGLRRARAPGEVNVFDAAKASFLPVTSFPQDTKEFALARLKWKPEVKDKYEAMVHTYELATMQPMGNPVRHRLLGYADFEQDFVAQVAKEDLSLLFQLGSDDNAGMCWGDGGYIYFWLRGSDLAQANFETILTECQCG